MSDVPPYDALLLVSFGGRRAWPTSRPFLEHVSAGRRSPGAQARGGPPLRAVRGVSPDQRPEPGAHRRSPRGARPRTARGYRSTGATGTGIPFLADTLRAMAGDGVRRALAFVTSAYSSYSGCRQYLEDIARARAEVGPPAPIVDKLRVFHTTRVRRGQRRPVREASAPCRRPPPAAADRVHRPQHPGGDGAGPTTRPSCARRAPWSRPAAPHAPWALVYQSRSGPPQSRG